MNGPPRKQVMSEYGTLRCEIAEYHRFLAEFPAVCRVLENIMLRIEHPLLGSEQTRYRSISNLRDELRAMVPTFAPGQTQELERQVDLEAFASDVKQLCEDYSSRDGSVYIKDVQGAIDSLLARHVQGAPHG